MPSVLSVVPAPTIAPMVQNFDICIRGSGIVGTTLALLLARERLKVALVSGTPPANSAASDVRAYALNSVSRTMLESLRCWPEPDSATEVKRMQVFGDSDGSVQFEAADQSVDALAWIVDVPALESRLLQAVRYQPQVEVINAPVPATLTVVCEGRASSSRAEFGAQFHVTPYPQHAIATRLHCEIPHGQTARQWFLPDGILAFLPLEGANGNSVAVVWSVSHEQAPELMALSAPEFSERLQLITDGALGVLTLSAERAVWPLQLSKADRWCGGMPAGGDPSHSWVLAGDAAHTVHPLAGYGLNLGLGDAVALARVLHGREYWRSVADLRLLRRYERERRAALLPVGMATDGLQQLFGRTDGPWQLLRNWGMKGFEHSGVVKSFVTRGAMGLR